MGNTDITAGAEANADTFQICSMCKNAGWFLQTGYLHMLMTWADHTGAEEPTHRYQTPVLEKGPGCHLCYWTKKVQLRMCTYGFHPTECCAWVHLYVPTYI